MRHTVTKVPGSKVKIEAVLTPEEWETERKQAEDRLAQDFKAEGFRQGKAPLEFMRAKVGEQAVVTETARRAVERAYLKVVREEGLEAIGEPELQVKKLAPGNPFEFRLTVSVLPSLELPDYKKIASEVEPREVQVQDREVEDALEWVRKSRAEEGKEPPELTDDFAKSLGAFGSLQEVRNSIKEGLEQEKLLQERQRRRQEILGKIAENARGDLPPELVDRELQAMQENLRRGVKEQLGMEFEAYLEKAKKSKEELEREFRAQAEERVRNSLVLREIAKAEGVQVQEDELAQGMEEALRRYASPGQARKDVDPERLKEYTRGVLENEKTLQLLESQQSA